MRVSDLVEQLGVSDMTVRRDIERLDADGLLERVHGGALALLPRATDEPGFSAKSSLMTAEKHAIAIAAAAAGRAGRHHRHLGRDHDVRVRARHPQRAPPHRGHQLGARSRSCSTSRAAAATWSC